MDIFRSSWIAASLFNTGHQVPFVFLLVFYCLPKRGGLKGGRWLAWHIKGAITRNRAFFNINQRTCTSRVTTSSTARGVWSATLTSTVFDEDRTGKYGGRGQERGRRRRRGQNALAIHALRLLVLFGCRAATSVGINRLHVHDIPQQGGVLCGFGKWKWR